MGTAFPARHRLLLPLNAPFATSNCVFLGETRVYCVYWAVIGALGDNIIAVIVRLRSVDEGIGQIIDKETSRAAAATTTKQMLNWIYLKLESWNGKKKVTHEKRHSCLWTGEEKCFFSFSTKKEEQKKIFVCSVEVERRDQSNWYRMNGRHHSTVYETSASIGRTNLLACEAMAWKIYIYILYKYLALAIQTNAIRIPKLSAKMEREWLDGEVECIWFAKASSRIIINSNALMRLQMEWACNRCSMSFLRHTFKFAVLGVREFGIMCVCVCGGCRALHKKQC